MKLGREVSRHNELDNWSNTHRFESVMATKWLLLTISETEPGLWDRLMNEVFLRLYGVAMAERNSAQWSINARRRSKRSERAYATSVEFPSE